MKRIRYVLLPIVLLCLQWTAALAEMDLADLAGEIQATATEGSGISKIESELAHEVIELGALAIPLLLPLLEHESRDVRALTSYILRDIEGLTEEHLPALIASRLRGDGWIPPAIARIGTPGAIEFLVDELKKERQTHTQLTYAIGLLGEKAIPKLVELHSADDLDDRLSYTVSSILGELGDSASGAVSPLIRIASNEELPDASRRFGIIALGGIGASAHRSAPILLKLAESDPPTFTSAVEGAIVRMGASEAADILLARIAASPKPYYFRDIGALKARGVSAGPALVRHLSNDSWDARVGAARALGYTGYNGASRHLIALLSDQDDWRLVYVSAESLGRLGSPESIPSLSQLSQSHWYPPVRKAAARAVAVINGISQYSPQSPGYNFAHDFFEYERVTVDAEDLSTAYDGMNAGESGIESVGFLEKFELERLSYAAQIIGYGSEGKHVSEVSQVPTAGIKVKDGYLVGANRGEWGGEVMFLDDRLDGTKLIDANLHGIYQTPASTIAVTGLAHLSGNRGELYKLSKDKDGNWQGEKWKILPGAPTSSALHSDGSLSVDCKGGRIVLTPDGNIRMAN